MLAKYILGALGVLFLLLGGSGFAAGGGRSAQGRVWLLIGVIFTAVSAWLFLQSP